MFAAAPPQVVLRPNPLPAAYQYWTCADMAKLRATLPGRPVLTTADVLAASGRLFASFADDSPFAGTGRRAVGSRAGRE